MNREILRIALPNVVSNITVPLMGIASTAIAGRSGVESAMAIGQLAVGVSIFNMIYQNCNFVRMGTSGLTAQAFGAKEYSEMSRMLVRALLLALAMGSTLLIFREPIAKATVSFVGGGDLALEYVRTRFWALPAGIMLFGLYGWFTGMQSGVDSMLTAIVVNILHLSCSIYFVLVRGVGLVGLAYSSIVAQWSGVAVALLIILIKYRGDLIPVTWREVMDRRVLKEFFSANTNIIARTLCNVAVYTYFTRFSARLDGDILAVNTMLMQLFMLFSYMSDGFSCAAEALTGRFIGARDKLSLHRAVRRVIVWGGALALIYMSIYLVSWREILHFLVSGSSDTERLLDIAGQYIGWGITLPLLGFLPFLIDGVMVGASLTRVMRNSMLIATVVYFLTLATLSDSMGNNALWLAFSLFIALRGVLPYLMTSRFRSLGDGVVHSHR